VADARAHPDRAPRYEQVPFSMFVEASVEKRGVSVAEGATA